MVEKSKLPRRNLKRSTNPFRITFDAKDGSCRRAMYCIKVVRSDDNYIVRFKDVKGLLCTMSLPVSEWSLRGEAEILFDEPLAPEISTPALEKSGNFVPVAPQKEVSEQPENPGNIEASQPKEYNAWDKKNWKPPDKIVNFEAHVASNFAHDDAMRRAAQAKHRREIAEKHADVSKGIENPMGWELW